MDHKTPLQRYRETQKLSLAAFASHFGIDKSTALRWQFRVPAERAVAVSEVTGIPLHELRPDVFPAPPKQEMAS